MDGGEGDFDDGGNSAVDIHKTACICKRERRGCRSCTGFENDGGGRLHESIEKKKREYHWLNIRPPHATDRGVNRPALPRMRYEGGDFTVTFCMGCVV